MILIYLIDFWYQLDNQAPNKKQLYGQFVKDEIGTDKFRDY